MNIAEIAESQPFQWRLRLQTWILERMRCPDAEKVATIDMISAGLFEAHNEGLDDAAEFVERLARVVSGESQRVLTIVAEGLRDLSQRNRRAAA